MQKFETPFFHLLIENFLSSEDFKKIFEAHSKTLFIEKKTDLFHFNQSTELVDSEDLFFFKQKLNALFEQLTGKEGELNIFASYYKHNNYLLCHDDMVDDRRYAFTFYLDDCESGNLILYEDDCVVESKRVVCKENLLVVFEVSDVSFHEVDICKNEVRRAYTGWFSYPKCKMSYENEKSEPDNQEKEDNYQLPKEENLDLLKDNKKVEMANKNYEGDDLETKAVNQDLKGYKEGIETENVDLKRDNEGQKASAQRIKEDNAKGDILVKNKINTKISQQLYPIPPETEYIPLNLELDTPTIIENVEFEIEGEEKIEGPFINRRIIRINPSRPVAFTIQSLKLVEMNFYRLRDGDYILLNDQMNSIGTTDEIIGKRLFDLFILKSTSILSINYVKDGETEFTVDLEAGKLYFIRRGGYDIFIERCFDEHVLAHFIYSEE